MRRKRLLPPHLLDRFSRGFCPLHLGSGGQSDLDSDVVLRLDRDVELFLVEERFFAAAGRLYLEGFAHRTHLEFLQAGFPARTLIRARDVNLAGGAWLHAAERDFAWGSFLSQINQEIFLDVSVHPELVAPAVDEGVGLGYAPDQILELGQRLRLVSVQLGELLLQLVCMRGPPSRAPCLFLVH